MTRCLKTDSSSDKESTGVSRQSPTSSSSFSAKTTIRTSEGGLLLVGRRRFGCRWILVDPKEHGPRPITHALILSQPPFFSGMRASGGCVPPTRPMNAFIRVQSLGGHSSGTHSITHSVFSPWRSGAPDAAVSSDPGICVHRMRVRIVLCLMR